MCTIMDLVGGHHPRSSLESLANHLIPHMSADVSIKGGEHIIKQHNIRLAVHSPCKRNALFLATAELNTLFTNERLETRGQSIEVHVERTKEQGVCQFCTVILSAEEDVLAETCVKEPSALGHIGGRTTTNSELSRKRCPCTREPFQKHRLAAANGPANQQQLSRMDSQGKVSDPTVRTINWPAEVAQFKSKVGRQDLFLKWCRILPPLFAAHTTQQHLDASYAHLSVHDARNAIWQLNQSALEKIAPRQHCKCHSRSQGTLDHENQPCERRSRAEEAGCGRHEVHQWEDHAFAPLRAQLCISGSIDSLQCHVLQTKALHNTHCGQELTTDTTAHIATLLNALLETLGPPAEQKLRRYENSDGAHPHKPRRTNQSAEIPSDDDDRDQGFENRPVAIVEEGRGGSGTIGGEVVLQLSHSVTSTHKPQASAVGHVAQSNLEAQVATNVQVPAILREDPKHHHRERKSKSIQSTRHSVLWLTGVKSDKELVQEHRLGVAHANLDGVTHRRLKENWPGDAEEQSGKGWSSTLPKSCRVP
mmetsp:Transcript_61431/g.163478  ORF Transcript_61431/g.163478 Transcript_61431/m.163478 type:complete len:535 (-) Transcript_61431:315-1919(-)